MEAPSIDILYGSPAVIDYDPFAALPQRRRKRALPEPEPVLVFGPARIEAEALIELREARKPFNEFQKRVLRNQADAADRITATPPKISQPGPGTFTTQYAIDWGTKQGWKLIDRERFNHRTKRHQDLQLASDAMFEGPEGLILVQGAGRGERKPHRFKFDERGGVAKAHHRHLKFVYVEFERGCKTPILEEWWA